MPFEAPTMDTMDEHVRRNIVSNQITDAEIVAQLRCKGYRHPQRYLDRFKERCALASDKLIMAVVEIIDKQDDARRRVN
jgi:hypothetical protein